MLSVEPSIAKPIADLPPEEIEALENRDVPTSRRASDRVETVEDERQEPATTLNFPLHWTSSSLSWNYLFDAAIACDLLGARPDDLVLDLAAGSCWASELLNRVGVRTIAIDLSTEMLRRGRARLAADSRLVFREEAWFVAGRGQELPLGDETVDGVLCMNALHHFPSYAAALREIHRVLRPGGKAVFSEPGETHAVQPLSTFRMREEGILEKSVALPLVRHLALDAGFTRMSVVPLRSPGTYAYPYTAGPDDQEVRRQLWADTELHGPGEHARFVLYKGDERPPDTHLPAEHLIGRLRASIVVPPEPVTVQHGQIVVQSVAVVNAGNVTWRARGRRFGGQVTLGIKVCDEQGQVLRDDLGRTPLDADLGPSARAVLMVRLQAVLPPGRYRLRYDMVVEGVMWFELQGSPCPTRGLTIAP